MSGLTLAEAYRRMRLIRSTEQRLLDLFSEGLISGTIHTCLGQEAIAVGVVSALDRTKDTIASNHRGHGHFLSYSEDPKGLMAEIMGLESGICGGFGGSQHLQREGFYSNGILGGMSPVTTGMAFAEKEKNSGAISVVFHGDGALGEGVIYESFNLASLWELPVLWVIEHNQYAQSTPTAKEHAGELARRAEPFGITVREVDGNDVMAVHAAASEWAEKVRETSKPHLLFCHTYRLGPHSKGDDDRAVAEIEQHRKRDPLSLAEAQMDAAEVAQITQEIDQQIDIVVTELRAEMAA